MEPSKPSLLGYTGNVPPGISSAPVTAFPAATNVIDLKTGLALTEQQTAERAAQAAQRMSKVNGRLVVTEALTPMVVDGAARMGLIGAAGGMVGNLANAGVVGAVAGAGVSILTSHHQKAMAEIELKERFGSMVATELGIPIEEVTIDKIREVSRRNEMLRQQMVQMEAAQSHHVKSSLISGLAGAGGWMVATALGPAGWIAGGAVALAGSMFASYGATAALNAIDGKKHLVESTGINALNELSDKIKGGGQASMVDVVKVFALGTPALGEVIKAETGASYPTKALEEMTTEELEKVRAILETHPKLAAIAGQYAAMINAGKMPPEKLAFINLEQSMGQEPVAITGGPALAQQADSPRGIESGKANGFAATERMRRQAANDQGRPSVAV